MAQKRFETALLITGDGSGGSRAIKMTREQLEALARIGKSTEQGIARLNHRADQLTDSLKDVGKASRLTQEVLQSLKSSFLVLDYALGVLGLSGISREILRVGTALDALESSFTTTFGQLNVGAELTYIKGVAKDLGLEMLSLSKSYSLWAAAAKGTALEGVQQKQVFESVAQAARVLGLSVDDTDGTLRALSQMISKGKVQAEELRGQLGERLPGAFKMAADAMGVSTAELDKMLQKGQVLAEDLLPKLAVELDKAYGGEGRAVAVQTLAAESNRLKNALTELYREIYQVVSPTLADWASSAAQSIDGLAGEVDTLMATGNALALMIGGRVVVALSAKTAGHLAATKAAVADAAASAKATVSYQADVAARTAAEARKAQALVHAISLSKSAAVADLASAKASLQAAHSATAYTAALTRLKAAQVASATASQSLAQARKAAAGATLAATQAAQLHSATTTAATAVTARYGLVSAAAAGSVRLLSGALALVGGPAGALVMVTAGMMAYRDEILQVLSYNRALKGAEEARKETLDAVKAASLEAAGASATHKAKLKEEHEQTLITAKSTLTLAEARLEAAKNALSAAEMVQAANQEDPEAYLATATDKAFQEVKRAVAALESQKAHIRSLSDTLKHFGEVAAASVEPVKAASIVTRDLGKASQASNKALKEARQLTESLRTPQEAYQEALAKLDQQLAKGLISQETYRRALVDYKTDLDEATGKTEAAQQAEEARQQVLATGKALMESLRTPHEVYQDQLAQTKALLDAGAITLQTYQRALADYKTDLDEATGKTEAAKHAEEARQQVLADGQALMESLRTPQEVYQDQLAQTKALLDAGAITLQTYQRALADYNTDLDEATGKTEAARQAEEDRQQVLAKGKALMESLRTPHEVYQNQLAQINALLAAGAITQQTYQRALKDYKQTLDDATGDQKFTDFMEKLNQEQALLVVEMTEGTRAAEALALSFEDYDETQRQSIMTTREHNEALQSLKATAQDIGNTLVEGLLSGNWKSAGQSLVSIFKDQILKPILTKAIEPFQMDLVQALSGEGGVSVLTQSGGLFSTPRLSQSSGMGGRYGRMFSNGLMGAGVGAGISSILGGDSKYGAIGGAIGSLFGGWGSVIGGALGGFAEKIFGGKKETTGTGLALSYGSGDFAGQQYEDWKKDGGWFRSDKRGTHYTAINDEITASMEAYFDEVESGLIQQAEYFGYDSAQSVIDGFSTGMVKLSGTDDMEARVNAWAAEVREQLYTGVFATDFDALSQDGESLAETLDRLILEIGVVETAVTGLGLSFGLSGIEAAKAADNIAQAVGGVANLATLTDTYYANFYSDTERLQNIVDDSMASIASFNEAQSTAIQGKEDLRAYVEALDLTSESGQLAFASAMELVPALVALSEAQDELGTSTDALLSQALGLRDAMRSIETGDLSTLAPVEQLALVRDDFSATYQSALSGDTSALDAIASEAQALLQLSRAFNASGAGYQADYTQVMSALDTLATRFEAQIKLDGSHAAGLAHVPHDGYRAELHQGESVIDARTMFGLKKYGIPVRSESPGAQNTALVSEIKALRREVVQLRQDQQQIARRAGSQRNTQIDIAIDTQQQFSTNQRAAERQQRLNM